MNNQQHHAGQQFPPQSNINQQHPSFFPQANSTRQSVTIIQEPKDTLRTIRGFCVAMYCGMLGWWLYGIAAFLGIFNLTMVMQNYFLYGAEFTIKYVGVWGSIALLCIIRLKPLRLINIFVLSGAWWDTLMETTPMNILLFAVNIIIELFMAVMIVIIFSVFEHLTGNDVIINNRPVNETSLQASYHNLNSWHNIQKIVDNHGKYITTQSYVGGSIAINLIDLVGSTYKVVKINDEDVRIYSPNKALAHWLIISLFFGLFWMQKRGKIDMYEYFIGLESKKKA